MHSVSRADGLCLTALLMVGVSVWAWWQARCHPSSATPIEIAGNVNTESTTAPTAAPTDSPPATDFDESDPPKPYLRWQHTYGDYWAVVTGNSDRTEKLQVFQKGHLVFETENYNIFDPERPEDQTNPPLMTDLTGEGWPCLVVASYSGGAHCCSKLDIFQLGSEFKHLGSIDLEHGGAEFVDLDGNGIPEVKLNDWSYAYVFASFSGVFAPEKILRYKDGQYVAAPELLFTDPPTKEEYDSLVKELFEAYAPQPDGDELILSPDKWGGNAKLWNVMLELTYKGHLELAMKLFDQCWQAEWPDKDTALDEFWDAVGRSEYGRTVVEAQGFSLPPSPNEEDKPSTNDIPHNL